MRIPSSFSISSVLLLTALVACCLYWINRRLNPSIPEQFQNLVAKIPPGSQKMFVKPASDQDIKAIDEAISAKLPGIKLPANIKKLYEICGGQPWDTPYSDSLFPSFSLNPTQNAIKDYEEFCYLYDFYLLADEKKTYPDKWYDYRLFPFGWAPGSGTCYCVDVYTERIYIFNPDGGTGSVKFNSVRDLLQQSLEYHRQEYGR